MALCRLAQLEALIDYRGDLAGFDQMLIVSRSSRLSVPMKSFALWLLNSDMTSPARILIGVGQVVWIALELISIPFSILMAIFGPLGLALALLPLTPSVGTYLKST